MLCTVSRRDLNQTIRQGKERMSSDFQMMCPRYSEFLPTVPMVIRLWETFTFMFFLLCKINLVQRLVKIFKRREMFLTYDNPITALSLHVLHLVLCFNPKLSEVKRHLVMKLILPMPRPA